MLNFSLSRTPATPARPNILLVDDDRDIRTVTNLVLMTSGLGTALEASTGQEGLSMARQHRPDVILLDFKLPDLSGERVLQSLKADSRTRDIPVIFFTAHAMERNLLRALPVAGLVLKPFQPQELCEVVRRAINGVGSQGAPEWTGKGYASPRMQPAAQ
jgi:CheY-like chemotaxis protein